MIVITSPFNLSKKDQYEARKSIMEQAKTGIILLPFGYTAIVDESGDYSIEKEIILKDMYTKEDQERLFKAFEKIKKEKEKEN